MYSAQFSQSAETRSCSNLFESLLLLEDVGGENQRAATASFARLATNAHAILRFDRSLRLQSCKTRQKHASVETTPHQEHEILGA